MRNFLILLLLLAGFKIYAQDPVPVSKEPRHKNVFENKYLRVLDVHLIPGDTTLFHKHETPSVFISLHPVKTGSQVIIQDGNATALSLDRRITFEGFYKSPRIHRVWNADTSVFHVMDIEVLTKGDLKIGAAITEDGFIQVFDAPPVRAYRLTLKGKQEIEIVRSGPVLVVGLDEANNLIVNKKQFSKQGDYLFAEPSDKIKFANKEEKEHSFAILELK